MSESATTSDLTLRVGQFEGPLDLLLHLCRTNEIDLAALPVRSITDQYLAHLAALEFQDLETAGAYLVMAATLIYLKSKLLPPPDDVPLEDLSVHQLERAMKRLISEQARRRPREVQPEPMSVLERMTEILTVLRDTWSLLFSSLTGGERRRPEIVVTLLAVLELTRLGRIRTQQTELFGDIVIERRPDAPGDNVPLTADSDLQGGSTVADAH